MFAFVVLVVLLSLNSLAVAADRQWPPLPPHKPQPPPNSIERSLQPRTPGAPTQEQQRPATEEKRGTEAVPLAVKIIPGPERQAEATDEKRRADEHAAAEQSLTDATWKLAWFTLALTAVALAQAGLFVSQLRLIKRSLSDAEIAARASEAGAKAAQTSADASRKTADVLERTLIATDRPWIAVRMAIPDGEPVIFGIDQIEVRIRIIAKNIGKSPATEVNCRAELYPDLVAANQRINSMGLIDVPHAGTGRGRMLIPEQEFCEEHIPRASVADFKRFLEEAASAQPADAAAAEGTDKFNEGSPAVVAIVWYRIPASRSPRHTIVVGAIRNTAPGKIGFDGSEGIFPDVKIIESHMGNRAT